MKLTTHLQLVPKSRRCGLYIHSPIRLHGMVPNQLSTETSLCLTLRCHKVICASGAVDPLLLTSAIDAGEWSASGPWCFTIGERAPSTHWVGGRLGLTADLTEPDGTMNSVALVRKRITTERPPLFDEVSSNFLRVEGVAWSAQRIHTVVNLGFLDRSRYFFTQAAPQLASRG
jgi:hypothetical protein